MSRHIEEALCAIYETLDVGYGKCGDVIKIPKSNTESRSLKRTSPQCPDNKPRWDRGGLVEQVSIGHFRGQGVFIRQWVRAPKLELRKFPKTTGAICAVSRRQLPDGFLHVKNALQTSMGAIFSSSTVHQVYEHWTLLAVRSSLGALESDRAHSGWLGSRSVFFSQKRRTEIIA